MPWPAEQIAPHEVLVATNAFGVDMPDGLPVPTFGLFLSVRENCDLCVVADSGVHLSVLGCGSRLGVNYDSSGLARLAVVFGVLFSAPLFSGGSGVAGSVPLACIWIL